VDICNWPQQTRRNDTSAFRVAADRLPLRGEALAALSLEPRIRATMPKMVDFNKRLVGGKATAKPLLPSEIYEKADRESDTGPLRPSQLSVLDEWHTNRRKDRDVIIKMHTGQGKTLIGLLILQSKLNEQTGPGLYICPNIYLVQQTVAQGKRFGIPCVIAERELPEAFTESEQILVTTVHKLFNGWSKFGLGAQSQNVGALVMDDCHACIDAIHQGMKITLPRSHGVYDQLVTLFSPDMKEQGAGTFAELEQGEYRSFLPVPYWAWTAHQDTVATILAKHLKTDEVKYAWPLIKDSLQHCTCIISGTSIEIEPHLPPLELFGSYANAAHRVFMSATVTNDAFLVKGLGLAPDTIQNPLVDKNERWAGEKMVLVPSLIDSTLERDVVIQRLAVPSEKRKVGVVAITPSFKLAEDWEKAGAVCPRTDTIWDTIGTLREGKGKQVVVIANRYDGIDLPDSTCRVLILDSKPQGETLIDRWTEACRAESEVTLIKLARTVEQGLGRSVRGEKDYSAIVIIGSDLAKQFRQKKTRDYFSRQTQQQIRIGLKIAEFAKEEIAAGKQPIHVLIDLINQCLRRDPGWKSFHDQQMAQLPSVPTAPAALQIFVSEYAAERMFQSGKPEKAAAMLQSLLDKEEIQGAERGWYLQEMARYIHTIDQERSNELQVAAHQQNRYLLKPRAGMVFEPISAKGQKRIERMIAWIKEYDTAEDLLMEINNITSDLRFGVDSDDFERAFDRLGKALGFQANRPDKELREGPDNVWALRDDLYWLVECKNQVSADRQEINKDETGQMNNSCAWFKKRYPGAANRSLMIIWTKALGTAAGFNEDVRIMTSKKLETLVKNVKSFFGELKGVDLQDLSETKLQANLDRCRLNVDELISQYSELPVKK
jgi:replicative superfamily II helicase